MDEQTLIEQARTMLQDQTGTITGRIRTDEFGAQFVRLLQNQGVKGTKVHEFYIKRGLLGKVTLKPSTGASGHQR